LTLVLTTLELQAITIEQNILIMQEVVAQQTSLQTAVLPAGYEILSELGKGSFSTVHLATKRNNNNKVALKILTTSTTDEADLHFKLAHDNIIPLLDSFTIDHGRQIMVLEYAQHGNLFDYVRSRARLGESQARHIFMDIVNGLCYLHSMLIVHGDLKPNNILIDGFHRAKIADFGHAKRYVMVRKTPVIHNREDTLTMENPNYSYFNYDNSISYSMVPEKSDVVKKPSEHADNSVTEGNARTHTEYSPVVSPAYAAPEIIDGILLDNPMAGDIWSLGVTLFYMVSGYLPFGSHSLASIRQSMEKSLRWPRPLSRVSRPCRKLVETILTIDQSQRPTCNDIRSNIWTKETHSFAS
jgi:serine/threonine protein kinase